uniref:GST m2 n=1 Tax=Tetranychus evansi TaxID=178897 RepID=A0A3G5APG5_9ACAR|nr:GST m2 [Tetranychus evansi]
MVPILAYWELRGLVDPIKFLLAHAGVEYEFKAYKIGPPPEYSRDDFRSIKDGLGLDFPNLPYYIDDDVKLSQTLAILRYLGRKHGLQGTSDSEITRCDLAEQVMIDLLLFLFPRWRVNNEENKKQIVETVTAKLTEYEKFLGSGPFVLGEKLSYPDFIAYSALDYIRLYDASLIENYATIKDFLAKFETFPNVDAYIKSDKFSRMPVTAPICDWGGKA